MMRFLRIIALLMSLTLLAACQPVMPVTEPATEAGTSAAGAEAASGPVLPTDDVELQIANAMSAAPAAVSQEATILGWPIEEGGDMVVLQEGTNEWTCTVDWP